MKISSVLTPEAVLIDLSAANREEAIRKLVSAVAKARSVEAESAVRDILARERSGGTVLPAGKHFVAVPHAPSEACKQLVMGVGTCPGGVPWDPAGPRADVVLLFLVPPQAHGLYLRAMSRVARLCETRDLVDLLLAATSPQELVDLIYAAEVGMEDIVTADGMPTFCVLGAGHGGLAMAGHLSLTGCKVNLFNRTPEHLEAVRGRGGIDVDGEVEGFARLNRVTADPAEAIDDVDILMVVVPATAHQDIAQAIAPHVQDGQMIVLNPGRTGGALEVARVLREKNPAVRPYIAEAQTLLYASRATNPAQVHIFRIKNSVPVAALPAWQTADVLPVLRKALPQFVPGDNVLKTSLDNIGAVFHPAITVLNAGRIEDTHGDFEYYVEGVTPAVAAVLEAIDQERVKVAAALGIRANTAREWLYLAYDAAGKTLLDAMRANPGYAGIRAPADIQNRYIAEDVPASLVPIASLGQMLGVPTPAIRSIVELACRMHGVDYWMEGRTVARLGIQGMSVKEIRFLVVGAEPAAASVGGGPGGEAASPPRAPAATSQSGVQKETA